MDVNNQQDAPPLQQILPLPNGVPNGFHLPMHIEPMNIQGNQPALFHRNHFWIITLIGFLVLAFIYFFIWMGYLIFGKYLHHHHHDTFHCQSTAEIALNGSANFTSVSAALVMAPSMISQGRHCIFVKSGVYHENIIVAKEKKNIALIGEGMSKTIIRINISSIKDNATIKVFSDGFIAKDAVVLRIDDDDHGAFYRCSFRGDRSTIHMVQQRQFFSSETVEYIEPCQ